MGRNSRLKRFFLLSLTAAVLFFFISGFLAVDSTLACTVGCAAGEIKDGGVTQNITVDGRPLLWKILNLVNNENYLKQLYSVDTAPLKYIVLTTRDKASSGNKPKGYTVGVNEAGVSVVYAINARYKKDDPITQLKKVPKPIAFPSNGIESGFGDLQKYIIGNCKTIEGVKDHLKKYYPVSTQAGSEAIIPYTRASGLYCVMDGTGKTLSFETSDKAYKIYEPVSTQREKLQLPAFDGNPNHHLSGFIVRSNRLHWRDNNEDELRFENGRYETGAYNILGMIWGDTVQTTLSPLQLFQGDGISNTGYEFLRYGNGNKKADGEINRPFKTLALKDTNAGMVVHGVRKGEDPLFSTLWLIPGHTNYGIAVPAWVTVTDIPDVLNSDQMTRCLDDLLKISNGFANPEGVYAAYDQFEEMIQKVTFPLEKHIYNEVNGNKKLMGKWRREGASTAVVAQMKRVEHQIADDAFSALNWFKMRYDREGAICPGENCPVLQTAEINKAPKIMIEKKYLGEKRFKFTARIEDADFDPAGIEWNFGDENKAMGSLTETHSYERPGKFLVSCTYTDSDPISPVSNTAWLWARTPALKDQWDFNDPVHGASFKSSFVTGRSLLKKPLNATIQTTEGHDRAAIVKKGTYLEMSHKLTSPKQWTLLMDVSYLYLIKDKRRALFQTDPLNTAKNAAECWISTKGHVGSKATGFSSTVLPNGKGKFNRLVFTGDVDATSENAQYRIFLDGKEILNKSFTCSPTNENSICSNLTLKNELLLFADGNGDDHTMRVSKVAIFDGVLSNKEIGALGTAGDSI